MCISIFIHMCRCVYLYICIHLLIYLKVDMYQYLDIPVATKFQKEAKQAFPRYGHLDSSSLAGTLGLPCSMGCCDETGQPLHGWDFSHPTGTEILWRPLRRVGSKDHHLSRTLPFKLLSPRVYRILLFEGRFTIGKSDVCSCDPCCYVSFAAASFRREEGGSSFFHVISLSHTLFLPDALLYRCRLIVLDPANPWLGNANKRSGFACKARHLCGSKWLYCHTISTNECSLVNVYLWNRSSVWPTIFQMGIIFDTELHLTIGFVDFLSRVTHGIWTLTVSPRFSSSPSASFPGLCCAKQWLHCGWGPFKPSDCCSLGAISLSLCCDSCNFWLWRWLRIVS